MVKYSCEICGMASKNYGKVLDCEGQGIIGRNLKSGLLLKSLAPKGYFLLVKTGEREGHDMIFESLYIAHGVEGQNGEYEFRNISKTKGSSIRGQFESGLLKKVNEQELISIKEFSENGTSEGNSLKNLLEYKQLESVHNEVLI